jgi:hypothetical protein
MAQDLHQQALERYKDAQEHMRENHDRMREDLRFSNPADPQQWDSSALDVRKGRPCLTFDRTNQFVAQVVNDARQNKPGIHTIPANSQANDDVATTLDGVIRHIEYVSRAGIAYDWAIECAARIGLGWIRLVPQVMRADTNEQEIRILRVVDPMSVVIDPDCTEPDGNGAMWGFAETLMSMQAFKAWKPKASTQSWEGHNGWFQDKAVRIAEYFCIDESSQNRILAETAEGDTLDLTEEEYWSKSQELGYQLQFISQYQGTKRKQKWVKMSGAEVLEETEFPSQFLPLIPVIGNETWIDGKRYLCGMTRRMMDSQRAYNYERSAFIESVAMQPKAPIMAAIESLEGHSGEWAKLNQGNPSVLPFNALDENNNPLPMPQRLSPPAFPAAFAQGGQIAFDDMQASIGMNRSSLGQQSNAVSGRAKLADKKEGDTANFHYIDNLSRSVEQAGRVVVDMIPRVIDTKRQARIVGEDGKHSFVKIDPSMQEPSQKEGKKITAINPGIGAYDVRVKVGPSYTSMREEAAQNIIEISQGNPQLGAALAPLLVKMTDMPEAEKVSKVAMALLPPNVQQAYSDEGGSDIPPEVEAEMQSMKQQIEQMGQQLQEAGKELEGHEMERIKIISDQEKSERDAEIKAYSAQTDRWAMLLAAGFIPPDLAGMTRQLEQDTRDTDITDNDEHQEPQQMQQMPPEAPMEHMEPQPEYSEPPGLPEPQQTQAPQGAFSLPEEDQPQG